MGFALQMVLLASRRLKGNRSSVGITSLAEGVNPHRKNHFVLKPETSLFWL